MVILAQRLRQKDHYVAILGYIMEPDQTRPNHTNHTMLRKGKGICLG